MNNSKINSLLYHVMLLRTLRMDNFGLTKTPFRRPRRYEFIDGLNVNIRLTDKKLWPWGVQTTAFYQCPKMFSVFYLKATLGPI